MYHAGRRAAGAAAGGPGIMAAGSGRQHRPRRCNSGRAGQQAGTARTLLTKGCEGALPRPCFCRPGAPSPSHSNHLTAVAMPACVVTSPLRGCASFLPSSSWHKKCCVARGMISFAQEMQWHSCTVAQAAQPGGERGERGAARRCRRRGQAAQRAAQPGGTGGERDTAWQQVTAEARILQARYSRPTS